MLEARADKLLSVVDSLTVIGMRLDEAESDAQVGGRPKFGENLWNFINLTYKIHNFVKKSTKLQILQAYQSGKQALADVLKKNNLTVDAVTEAMLDVQEVKISYKLP